MVITQAARVTAFVVFALAAFAFILSFSAIRAFAESQSVSPSLSWLFPLVVDGAIIFSTRFAFSLSILRATLLGETAWWSWVLVILFVILSCIFNALHADGEAWVSWSVLLAVTPPVALALSFEVLMGQIRSAVRRGSVIATLEELTKEAEEKAVSVGKLDYDRDKLTDKIETKRQELKELRTEVRQEQKKQSDNQPKRSDIVTQRRSQIRDMMADGDVDIQELADKFGVTVRTIRRDIEEIGK